MSYIAILIGAKKMKKDFNKALKKPTHFDGISISQTEEEREAQRDKSTHPLTQKQILVNTNNPTQTKKQRRISLYMEEGNLLDNLDSYCQVHGISKNKFIIKIIEEYLTEERMKKVRQSLEALQ